MICPDLFGLLTPEQETLAQGYAQRDVTELLRERPQKVTR